jgi:exoribonuclease II
MLVEFRQGEASAGLLSNRRLAVLERPEGKKHWVAVDDRGQNHTLHPRDLTYTFKGNEYTAREIGALKTEIESYLDPSALEVAWEFLYEDKTVTDAVAMAELLFSDQSPVCCYAAYILLSEDKLYFKQRKDQFEPRTQAQVAELKHQLSVEQEKHSRWQGCVDRLKQKMAGEPVELEERDRPYLEALERLATFGNEANNRAPALDLLKALDRGSDAEAAFHVLVELGHWQPHENLLVRRKQLPLTFAPQVLDVTQSRLATPPPDLDAASRVDLTHLKVYTIDDESTCEIDDGLGGSTLLTPRAGFSWATRWIWMPANGARRFICQSR